MKTIAIIDCAIKEPSLACYNRLLQLGLPVSYHSACNFGLSTFENLENFHGAIIFGSVSNVEDDHLWHHELANWSIRSLKQGFPILGICFGHQLICHHLGAQVVKNQEHNGEQKGSREVVFKSNFGDINPRDNLEFVVYHSFRVINLPSDFEELASSKFPNDIVKHRVLPFVGIQPHPEASDHFINHEFKHPPLEVSKANRTKLDGMKFIINWVREYCINNIDTQINSYQ
jgi:GMP synthase-like glutamine amidotransferase